jgi:hypothetical protein
VTAIDMLDSSPQWHNRLQEGFADIAKLKPLSAQKTTNLAYENFKEAERRSKSRKRKEVPGKPSI